MGVVDVLEGKVVAIDTAPLIYFIERHPTFHVHVRPLFAALDEGRYRAVT